MSGFSTRASWALTRLRWGDCNQPPENGWYRVGLIGNLGRKTITELLDHPELEWANLPAPDEEKAYRWGRVRVRVRGEPVSLSHDHRVVLLLEEILTVLKERL